jgi:hypothetical protein
MYSTNSGLARGMLRRSVPTRGGQLEIAGVVVGSWGPNYGTRGGMGGPPHSGSIAAHRGFRLVPPQVEIKDWFIILSLSVSNSRVAGKHMFCVIKVKIAKRNCLIQNVNLLIVYKT